MKFINMPAFSPRPARLPILLLAGLLAEPRLGAGPPGDANGASPRPFYIVAHNPNTIADVVAALNAGANALEPDITKAYDGGNDNFPDTIDYLVNWDSSVPFRNGNSGDTHFIQWLDGVHQLALQHQQIALITFDTKTSAAKAALGPVILNAIRTHLNTNGVNIPFVISVGSTNDGAVFDNILSQLGPTEGVQVDGQNDPAGVLRYFAGRGYLNNVTVGDGGAAAEFPLVANKYWQDMDQAAFLRAKTGNPKALPYLYIFDNALDENKIIDGGEDGIIPDAFSAVTVTDPPFSPKYIADLYHVIGTRRDIRLAAPTDNPFQPKNEAYALEMVTSSDTDSGTDAVLTFTLIGDKGSSSIQVDANKWGRMEAGAVDHVTIPSKDLGNLQFVQISNDGSGNAPGWKLHSLAVFSARWLSPVSPVNGGYYYTASTGPNSQTIDVFINSGQTSGFRLTAQSSQPYTVAWANAATTALPADGSSTHPWPQVFSATTYVRTNGVVHLGPGAYKETGRIDRPCRLVKEPTYGSGSAVIGTH